MQIDTRRVGVQLVSAGGTNASQSLPCTGFMR